MSDAAPFTVAVMFMCLVFVMVPIINSSTSKDNNEKEEIMLERKIIAVDFDGFLVEDKFPKIGKPIIRNIDLIKKLQAEDHKIILWTGRNHDRLAEAISFLYTKHDLKFDAVNSNLPEIIKKYGSDSRKIEADMYLDDRNATVQQAHVLLGLGMTEKEWHEKNGRNK